MKIATWNVNSIRTRIDQLGGWVARSAPDVVCVQETKVEDAVFPMAAINELGYHAAIVGQKTYNGVAILARFGLAIDDVTKRLDGDDETSHKRFIAASIEGIRVVNVYVPNGQSVGSEAFLYKLNWLKRLRQTLENHHTPEQPLMVCGDFNVAPAPIDVHDPKKWEGQILCHPDERAALKNVMDWGLSDILRERHPEPKIYSWWDYRMGAFKRNAGLRIDLALVTRSLAARCKDAWVEKAPRELERPSDHAPVVVQID